MLGSYQREGWIFCHDIWINWAFPAVRKQKAIGDAWSKKDLKTETSTKKHDSMKRQSTVCCPHLQSHPACSSSTQLLPQTECQCSSSPASQALHPRHEGGDVNQSVFGLDGAFMLAVEPQEAHPESRRNYCPGTAPFFALASICSSTLLGPYGNFSGIHQNKLTALFPPHYLCMNMAFTWYNFFPGVLCSSDVFK